MERNALIKYHLKQAFKFFPHENRFHILYAQFKMLKRNTPAVPDVGYYPNFLLDDEERELKNILGGLSWIPDDENVRFLVGMEELIRVSQFENTLGNITDRLQRRNFFTKGHTRFTINIFRYDDGGRVRQHRDFLTFPYVLGINIGGKCNLDFVMDGSEQKISLPLKAKSVYTMEGKSHEICTHGISDVESTRYVIVFFVPETDEKRMEFDLVEKRLHFVDYTAVPPDVLWEKLLDSLLLNAILNDLKRASGAQDGAQPF